jgi:hypothetical protein
MCSVAEGLHLARLAAAEEDPFGGLRFPSDRREAGAFMRAVAEWLAFGAPTGTPKILLSSRDIDRIGRFLRWNRFRHVPLPNGWRAGIIFAATALVRRATLKNAFAMHKARIGLFFPLVTGCEGLP